jgi:hypothetical protein
LDNDGAFGVKFQPGTSISPRAEHKVSTALAEIEPPEKYHLVALARIERILQRIARKVADVSKPVDEYSIADAGFTATGVVTVEVLPQYELISEIIESIIVTGPTAASFSLALGDRFYDSMSLPGTGLLVIAPVAIMLGRNDRRVLTSTTSGPWTLELMGHADERY